MKSLHAQHSILSLPAEQINILQQENPGLDLEPFQHKLEKLGAFPLRATGVRTLQINLGKMCNQTCRHCHVDAGPDRKEIMSRDTMEHCLNVLRNHPQLEIVDLTGGAPELNPHFRSFVSSVHELNRHVIVRCNLTIILANKRFYDLPDFFRQHAVEVVSSLPFYTQDRTDRQRGNGVFEDSIKALKMLNEAGYGIAGTGLVLNLVYNPAGAFLPAAQDALEAEYRVALKQRYGIYFNNLYTITNMPISRYLDYLLTSGNYEKYMRKLTDAYNPAAVGNVMCRNILSVGWDGRLYDCDFNQMLELQVDCSGPHISGFDMAVLDSRPIVVGQHCYGCTAGAGSSCGGAVV